MDFFGLLTGLKSVTVADDTSSKVELNGRTVKCAPGLRILDKKGVSCARRQGWLMSYESIKAYTSGDCRLDWITHAGLRQNFHRLSNALIQLESERKRLKVIWGPDERHHFAETILEQLISSVGSSKDDLCMDGIPVLRLKRDLPFYSEDDLKVKLDEYSRKGFIPPVYVLNTAMEFLNRNTDLLSNEVVDSNSTLLIEPSNTRAQSTGVGTFLDQSLNDFSCDLSHIEFKLQSGQDEVQSFIERRQHNLTTDGELESISSKLNETLREQSVLQEKVATTQVSVSNLQNSLVEQRVADEAEKTRLMQTIADREREITEKDAEIDIVKQELLEIKQEHKTEMSKLELENEKVQEQLHDVKKASLHSVPVDDFNELQSKIEDLEHDRTALASKLASEKIKAKRSDQHLKDRIEQLSRKEEHLTKVKKELTNDLNESKKRIAQVDWELLQKREQLNTLERQNAKLEASISRMRSLKARSKQLSQESDQANELNRSMTEAETSSPRPSLARQDAIEALELLSPSKPANLVAALTTKEITTHLPKWADGESMRKFCRKIETVWKFCQTNGVTEEMFCNLLYLRLPEDGQELVDGLDGTDSQKVEKVIEALKSSLDKSASQYFSDFNNCKKKATETHNAFALRIMRLFKLGTASVQQPKAGDPLMMTIVENFLKGLPKSESSALRLVASEEERKDVLKLAKRAAYGGFQSAQEENEIFHMHAKVDAKPTSVTEQTQSLPSRQQFSRSKKPGNCAYCKIAGHWWRECRKRATKDPNWVPKKRNGGHRGSQKTSA